MKIKKIIVKEAEYSKSRVYFLPDETIGENLENRRGRPYNEYRKMLPKVFKKAGIPEVKANWRQTAGCSCGCSPGFILEHEGVDIFVDIA